MRDCIVYWKHYWEDVEKFKLYKPILYTCHWSSQDHNFFSKVHVGGNIWVIIRGGKFISHEWRLLQCIHVKCLDTINKEDFYGNNHALADIKQSHFFEVNSQKDLMPILHKLSFQSGKAIPRDVRESVLYQ
jgi:hypothetical protein